MDVLRLIAEVQKRGALWDKNIALFFRKVERDQQWLDVSDNLQLDVTPCKKRFKTLRNYYRREIRKLQQGRIQVSKWKYFSPLDFLRSIFDPTGLVVLASDAEECSYGYDQLHLDDFNFDFDLDWNDDSLDFVIMGDIFKRDSPEQLHLPANPSMLAGPSSSSDGPIWSGNNNNSQMTTTNVADSLPVASSPSRSESKDDADYNFLVSLMPHVKSLSEMGNLKFRMEVSRVLVELKKEETTPEPPGMEADTDPYTYFIPKTDMNGYPGKTMDEGETFAIRFIDVE